MKVLELELNPLELYCMKEIESEQKTFVQLPSKTYQLVMCQN